METYLVAPQKLVVAAVLQAVVGVEELLQAMCLHLIVEWQRVLPAERRSLSK